MSELHISRRRRIYCPRDNPDGQLPQVKIFHGCLDVSVPLFLPHILTHGLKSLENLAVAWDRDNLIASQLQLTYRLAKKALGSLEVPRIVPQILDKTLLRKDANHVGRVGARNGDAPNTGPQDFRQFAQLDRFGKGQKRVFLAEIRNLFTCQLHGSRTRRDTYHRDRDAATLPGGFDKVRKVVCRFRVAMAENEEEKGNNIRVIKDTSTPLLAWRRADKKAKQIMLDKSLNSLVSAGAHRAGNLTWHASSTGVSLSIQYTVWSFTSSDAGTFCHSCAGGTLLGFVGGVASRS